MILAVILQNLSPSSSLAIKVQEIAPSGKIAYFSGECSPNVYLDDVIDD